MLWRSFRRKPMSDNPTWLTPKLLEKAANFAFAKLKTSASAPHRDDCMSEAFERVASYLRKNPGKEPSLNQLVNIMYCAMIDQLRASKLRRTVEVSVGINPRGYSPRGTHMNPSGEQVGGVVPQDVPAPPKRAKVKRAVVIEEEVFNKLGYIDRTIVELAMQGKNQAEIAEAINGLLVYGKAGCEFPDEVLDLDIDAHPDDTMLAIAEASRTVELTQQAVSKRLSRIKKVQAEHEKKMPPGSRVRKLITPAEDARIL